MAGPAQCGARLPPRRQDGAESGRHCAAASRRLPLVGEKLRPNREADDSEIAGPGVECGRGARRGNAVATATPRGAAGCRQRQLCRRAGGERAAGRELRVTFPSSSPGAERSVRRLLRGSTGRVWEASATAPQPEPHRGAGGAGGPASWPGLVRRARREVRAVPQASPVRRAPIVRLSRLASFYS